MKCAIFWRYRIQLIKIINYALRILRTPSNVHQNELVAPQLCTACVFRPHSATDSTAMRPSLGARATLGVVLFIMTSFTEQGGFCGATIHARADVSFVAGVTVDKFLYHLPLYRIHQRLQDMGFTLSRAWLTQLMQQIARLLEPIYEAQFESIRASRVKAMDETPIKAGLKGLGKMKQGYFWPVYGELDEICFPYCESRRAEHVDQLLGLTAPPGSVLITDGYAAYSRYAQKTEGLTHAQCWAHTRREFFESQDADPQRAAVALEMIGNLYAVEAEIREQGLKGAKKQDVRLTKAKPLVEAFFTWVADTAADTGLLPSNPLSKALAYAHKRRAGLEVFLSDADVPIDTNHLERGLRVIPMSRRAWLVNADLNLIHPHYICLPLMQPERSPA